MPILSKIKKLNFFLNTFFLLFSSIYAAQPNPCAHKYKWMDKLVEKNFRPFCNGFSQQSIEQTKDSHPWLVRIKVIDNKVYPVQGEKGAAFAMLEYLVQNYGLPDLDILYCQQDGLYDYILGGAPIFCSSKKKNVRQGIYFVDWYTHMSKPDWDQICNAVDEALKNFPWNKKKEMLIWRGATTDGWYTPDNWKEQRRGKLCYFSLLYPDLIDARFVGVCPVTCSDPEALAKAIPLANFMTHEDQVSYKYQIVLDGMFTTYPGDRWRLLSNSVVFMHESAFGHWFYDALRPWVHYVPLKSDLSDLLEKLNYIQAHPKIAAYLACNAREFALNFLMSEPIAIYCYKALLKYATLQRFQPCL